MFFQKCRSSGTTFGSKPWIYMTKIPGFPDFFGIPPTLRSHNFFSTEPILNFLDSMESYESNSFISAILVTQSKPRAPIDAHLWRGFSKMSIHSPTKYYVYDFFNPQGLFSY